MSHALLQGPLEAHGRVPVGREELHRHEARPRDLVAVLEALGDPLQDGGADALLLEVAEVHHQSLVAQVRDDGLPLASAESTRQDAREGLPGDPCGTEPLGPVVGEHEGALVVLAHRQERLAGREDREVLCHGGRATVGGLDDVREQGVLRCVLRLGVDEVQQVREAEVTALAASAPLEPGPLVEGLAETISDTALDGARNRGADLVAPEGEDLTRLVGATDRRGDDGTVVAALACIQACLDGERRNDDCDGAQVGSVSEPADEVLDPGGVLDGDGLQASADACPEVGGALVEHVLVEGGDGSKEDLRAGVPGVALRTLVGGGDSGG